jgi:hypothetical protein
VSETDERETLFCYLHPHTTTSTINTFVEYAEYPNTVKVLKMTFI